MATRLTKLKKEQEDLLGFVPESVIRNEYGLTIKEEAFAQHYVREANATLAAKMAGCNANNNATAASIGYEMLRLPHIASRVWALRKATEKGHDGLREKIINKLMVMADLDIGSLYDELGNLKPVHEWDLEARTSVTGIDTTHDLLGFNTTKKVKLSERTKALDMLIKMQGYNAPVKVSETDLDGNYVPATININIVPPKEE